jgi:hypothetical protein
MRAKLLPASACSAPDEAKTDMRLVNGAVIMAHARRDHRGMAVLQQRVHARSANGSTEFVAAERC